MIKLSEESVRLARRLAVSHGFWSFTHSSSPSPEEYEDSGTLVFGPLDENRVCDLLNSYRTRHYEACKDLPPNLGQQRILWAGQPPTVKGPGKKKRAYARPIRFNDAIRCRACSANGLIESTRTTCS